MGDDQKPSRPVKVYKIDKSMKLNAKQSAFVYEYLIDYNATQAAIRAGYSKKSAKQMGTENLAKPFISKAIEKGRMFYMFQNGMDADWIRKMRLQLLERCLQAEPVMVKIDGKMVEAGEYVFKEVTARGILADMAKDIGMDAPTQIDVNNSGTVKHEHTVQEQMNFDSIRSKVNKHKEQRLN